MDRHFLGSSSSRFSSEMRHWELVSPGAHGCGFPRVNGHPVGRLYQEPFSLNFPRPFFFRFGLVPLCRLTGPKPSSSFFTILVYPFKAVTRKLFLNSSRYLLLWSFSMKSARISHRMGIADPLKSVLHAAYDLLAQGRPLGVQTHHRGLQQTE